MPSAHLAPPSSLCLALLALAAAACTDGGSDGKSGGGSTDDAGAGGNAATGGRGAGGEGAGGTAAGGGSSAGGRAGGGGSAGASGSGGASVVPPPRASCDAAPGGGSSAVAAPTLLVTLADRWEEGWLASPAVADLDGDGVMEIIVARGAALLAWRPDGTLAWKFTGASGRIWASPIVADLVGDDALEIAFAARDKVFALDASGAVLPGFPVTWEDEMRSLAAGDVDGDGRLDLVAAPARSSPTDVMMAWRADGTPVAGFPPNGSGASGCDDRCYLAGCYDQNLAVGDLDGDDRWDVVAPHDNAYASIHRGTGEAFGAHSRFPVLKTPGVRYLHDLSLAEQGWANDEDVADQAHFTNTAPAIADVNGDGTPEVVMLASVQNAAQTDRERGVAVWVVGADANRIAGWEEPFHASGFLSGLWDYGDNLVGITNQVTVAELDPDSAGMEVVFADFGGRIRAVAADRTELWSVPYTTNPGVATGGVLVADLSGDGSPEVVFATYSTEDNLGELVILDAGGNRLHGLPLPRRGAMPVPTLADVDGNGTLEIVVSLKDAEDRTESVLVFTVPGSAGNCLLWPTGRANLLRNGWVR